MTVDSIDVPPGDNAAPHPPISTFVRFNFFILTRVRPPGTRIAQLNRTTDAISIRESFSKRQRILFGLPQLSQSHFQ